MFRTTWLGWKKACVVFVTTSIMDSGQGPVNVSSGSIGRPSQKFKLRKCKKTSDYLLSIRKAPQMKKLFF
jgi:hypothetical protein